MKTTRYAPTTVHESIFCRAATKKPEVNVPRAAPRVPKRVYHAKMSLRISFAVNWVRIDSSTALKGPISFPLSSSQFHSARRTQVLGQMPWANDPNHAGQNQKPIVGAQRKDHTTHSHKRCTCSENLPPADLVSDQGQTETDDHIPQESERHEQANPCIRDI